MSSTFKLSDDFVLSYSCVDVHWGPVGYITYKRTYARPYSSTPARIRYLADHLGLPRDGSEEWWLTCTRVIEGMYTWQKRHCEKYNLPWDEAKAQRSAQEAYDRLFNFKWLPPGRGLWMMGTDYVEKQGGAALNNCAFISTEDIDRDFADPFTFCMDMSMLGVGVGFDTLGAGKVSIQYPAAAGTFVVEDSREGWVALVRKILLAYAGVGTAPAIIDYSHVRPPGAKIKSFGGTSSGPAPLKELINDIKSILDPLIGLPITVTAIVDLYNAIGRCVVSGNVRRSAEIALGPATEEFISLKEKGNGRDSWSWCSNNSVVDPEDYTQVAARIATNGEPGIFWLQNARAYGRLKDEKNFDDERAQGTNPCSEQTLESRELCCLVETFPSLHDTPEDFFRTLKFAYLYAKTVTCIPTHDARTNAVMLRNRRIGCSQSGITEALERFQPRAYFRMCDVGYNWVEYYDEVYSDWLCVPRSIKLTSVKPSGSVSKLPGVSEGIHYPISEYYWQVIRFASDSPYLLALRSANYNCIELTNEPNTTAVYFPCKVRCFSKARSEVSMWEQLELTAQMQYWWADNQVSSTVTFNSSEARDIPTALSMYESRLKGIAMLPLDDHEYEHAPQQAISKHQYEHEVARLKPLDLTGGNHEVTDEYCDGDSCLVEYD